MNNLQTKLDGLERKIEARSQSTDVLLPDWPESKRGTPNSFLRSALFSVNDCKKERPHLDRVILASQEGITVTYTGKLLNQEDLTLWESLVHLSKEHPLGYICDFTAYEILKAMKLLTSGPEYARLKDGVLRLVECTVHINHSGRTFAGHLIESVAIDDDTGRYKIEMGRQLIKLYSESTWIDVGQRLQLRRKSLAQFLHGYYSSHKTPYPVKVATLHSLSGSGIKNIASFKQKLKAALDELVKIDFLESYDIADDLVSVTRNGS